jgi:hypothetical protein
MACEEEGRKRESEAYKQEGGRYKIEGGPGLRQAKARWWRSHGVQPSERVRRVVVVVLKIL